MYEKTAKLEDRLAKLEARASPVTQLLGPEGKTHQPVHIEALSPLEEAFNILALFKALLAMAEDQVQ